LKKNGYDPSLRLYGNFELFVTFCMKPLNQCVLYGIVDTGYLRRDQLSAMASQLIQGGADILQLRAKNMSEEEILSLALEIAPLCRGASIPFILNDHPELVARSGADGVHIGQDDHSVADARQIAGPSAIVGKSTHSLEQALEAAEEHPDYIGFGPIFATPTKPDYVPIGTELIAQIHSRLRLPIFCIGGIKLSNLPQILGAGAKRVAIVSDLLQAPDPQTQTARCKAALQNPFPIRGGE